MNGKIISVQTLRSFTLSEFDSKLEKQNRNSFNKAIYKLYGDYRLAVEQGIFNLTYVLVMIY